MIQRFVNAWFKNLDATRSELAAKHPENYECVVRTVVRMLAREFENNELGEEYPSPNRVHEINDGDYQGTLVYVIGAEGYQPSTYWWVKVEYGSCSGCDTLEGIKNYSDETPTKEQANEYLTLALHILQGLKLMKEDEAT